MKSFNTKNAKPVNSPGRAFGIHFSKIYRHNAVKLLSEGLVNTLNYVISDLIELIYLPF